MMDFEAFVKDISDNGWAVHGAEVYENGVLLNSFGDTCDNIYDLYSATKAVVSCACGILYDRGMLDLHAPILTYMPKARLGRMSAEQRERFAEITVERLLTMSVDGFPFRPEGDSYLDFSLACLITNPSAIVFNYNNINAYLIGVALTEILGRDLGAFIEEELFKPLGIANYTYGRCPEGYFYGASKLKLSVHDFSRFGLMLCNGGVYNGKRILSEEYIRLATSGHLLVREGNYGYFIWGLPAGVFRLSGKWGQKCFCFPERGLVITYLSNMEEGSEAVAQSMERHLL